MGKKAKWWDEGYDDEEAAKEATHRSGLPRRHWMPGGDTKELTFLTDKAFKIREHNMKANGNWRNWMTCTREKSCPMCLAGNTPYLAYIWLVVHHSKWVDKQKNEHQHDPKLFVAKAKIAARYDRAREKHDGLRGCRFEVFRTDNDAANVGDDIEYQKKLKPKDLSRQKWYPKNKTTKKGDIIGVDWTVLDDNEEKNRMLAEYLAPKTAEEMKALLTAQRDDQEVEAEAKSDDYDEGVRY